MKRCPQRIRYKRAPFDAAEGVASVWLETHYAIRQTFPGYVSLTETIHRRVPSYIEIYLRRFVLTQTRLIQSARPRKLFQHSSNLINHVGTRFLHYSTRI